MPESERRDVVRLVGARLPADGGLSSLGLLMEIGGSLFAALTAIFGLEALLGIAEITERTYHGATSPALWIVGFTALGMVRAMAHRAAGLELLYGTRPLTAIRRYQLLAAAHTALGAGYLALGARAPLGAVVAVTLLLAAWPVTLALVFRQRHLRQVETGVPLAEDKGFEGAAVLMTIFGVCGFLFSAFLLATIVQVPNAMALSGMSLFLLVLLVLLLVRGGFHIHAGWRGLTETHMDRAVEATLRYADFGVLTAFAAGLSAAAVVMYVQAGIGGLLLIGGVVTLLLLWPFTVRRFFGERQFADIAAADQAPLHRRAPDLGLTSLGWVLLAFGVLGLAWTVPQAVLSSASQLDDSRALSALFGFLPQSLGHSPWWNVGVSGLQVWAAVELIRMSDQHRVAATTYGIVHTALTLYVYMPLIEQLDHIGRAAFGGGFEPILLVSLAFALVLPVSTVVLVNRAHAPAARARIRAAAAAGDGPVS